MQHKCYGKQKHITLWECRLPSPRQIITPRFPNVIMLSLGEGLPQRFWIIITCTTIWVCYHYYGVSFAHLHILEYPDQHQNLISSSLYYPGPLHSNPFITFWVMLSTDKQTDRQTNANKNVTSFPKEAIKIVISFFITLLPIHILAPTPPIASCNCWIPWASYPFSIFDSLHHPGLWQLSNMVFASFMVSQTHITQLHKDSRS